MSSLSDIRMRFKPKEKMRAAPVRRASKGEYIGNIEMLCFFIPNWELYAAIRPKATQCIYMQRKRWQH